MYSMVCEQKTNILPENASQIDTIFPKIYITVYWTTSQCLSSYSCAKFCFAYPFSSEAHLYIFAN